MIDSSKLILNLTGSPEITKNAQDELKPDLSITEETGLSDENNLDESNSFIILMSHIMANPLAEIKQESAKPCEDGFLPVHQESDYINSGLESNEGVSSPLIENNVALAWIDSNQFQMSQVANPLEIDNPIQTESIDQAPINNILHESQREDINPFEWIEHESGVSETLALKKENKFSKTDVKVVLNKSSDRISVFENPTHEEDSASVFSTLPPEISVQDNKNNKTSTPVNGILPNEGHGTLVNSDQQSLMIIESQAVAQRITMSRPLDNVAYQEAHFIEIPHDLSSHQWIKHFSDQILWLGHQEIKSAQIKIHPEDLGLIEIGVKLVKNEVSLSINSSNHQVRELVDQSLTRLKEMMNEQGVNLSEVHIGHGSDSRPFSQQGEHRWKQDEVQIIAEEVQLTPQNSHVPKGLIDYFA